MTRYASIALALPLAIASASAARAGSQCVPCLEFYDVRAGFHQFVGAQDVKRCGNRTTAGRQYVYGYVDGSDAGNFSRIMAGDPGFDAAVPIGRACGARNVSEIKRELQQMTDAATEKYANLGYTILRQSASLLLNTACAEEAERVRMRLSQHGYVSPGPVVESPLNLTDGSIPPAPPPP
ncbi:MAG: hypothetical protein U1E46_14595 [Hyphomicrobiales bacterium]